MAHHRFITSAPRAPPTRLDCRDVPVATRSGRPGRAGSRLGRRLPRTSGNRRLARVEQLTRFLERWAPPGGWIVGALALVTLSAAAGVILPASPAGILLQSAVGLGGAPLVPAWTGWMTWALARRRRPSGQRAIALGVLSATWLLALALRQPEGGGTLGETLLNLLDAGFGRNSGLALVSVAAAASAVSLVGLERILGWVALAAGRLPRSALRVPQRPRFSRRSSTALGEPVILGPPSLPEVLSARPSQSSERSSRHVERNEH